MYLLLLAFAANHPIHALLPGLEYIPYVFQVLAQMLEFHNGGAVPGEYRNLLPILLTPAMWQQKGSIPGLVRLLKAFLSQDNEQMFVTGQVASVLAVVQQRLIPSKLNDAWGIELLQAVITCVKPCVIPILIFIWGMTDRVFVVQYEPPTIPETNLPQPFDAHAH